MGQGAWCAEWEKDDHPTLAGTDISRQHAGAGEWVEGTVDLAVELLAALDAHRANQDFGKWFRGRYRNSAVTPHERAVLIRWGAANGSTVVIPMLR
jgi:hypothetical protein